MREKGDYLAIRYKLRDGRGMRNAREQLYCHEGVDRGPPALAQSASNRRAREVRGREDALSQWE